MITQQTLTMATLAIAIVSMLMSMIALWPQWREQFAVLRDFVLWGALVLVAAILLNASWSRSTLTKHRPLNAEPAAMDFATMRFAPEPSSQPSLEPLPDQYRGADFLAPIER
jgi:hypothetical protein